MARTRQTVSEAQAGGGQENTSTHVPIPEGDRRDDMEPPMITAVMLLPMITALQEGQKEITRALAATHEEGMLPTSAAEAPTPTLADILPTLASLQEGQKQLTLTLEQLSKEVRPKKKAAPRSPLTTCPPKDREGASEGAHTGRPDKELMVTSIGSAPTLVVVEPTVSESHSEGGLEDATMHDPVDTPNEETLPTWIMEAPTPTLPYNLQTLASLQDDEKQVMHDVSQLAKGIRPKRVTSPYPPPFVYPPWKGERGKGSAAIPPNSDGGANLGYSDARSFVSTLLGVTETMTAMLTSHMSMMKELQATQREMMLVLSTMTQGTRPGVTIGHGASTTLNESKDRRIALTPHTGGLVDLRVSNPTRGKSLVAPPETVFYDAKWEDQAMVRVPKDSIELNSDMDRFRSTKLASNPYPTRYGVGTSFQHDKEDKDVVRNTGASIKPMKFRAPKDMGLRDPPKAMKASSGNEERGSKRALPISPPEARKRTKSITEIKEGGNEGKSNLPPPPFRCSMAQVHLALDRWINDGSIQLPKPYKEPTPEDMDDPRYCRYHRHLRHATKDCWTLQKLFNEEYKPEELSLERENVGDVQLTLFHHRERERSRREYQLDHGHKEVSHQANSHPIKCEGRLESLNDWPRHGGSQRKKHIDDVPGLL